MKKKIFYEIFMRFLTLSIRDSNLGFTDSFGHPKRNDVPITAKSDWKIANTAVTYIKRFLLFTGQSVLHPSFVPEQRTCESNLTVPPSYIQLKFLVQISVDCPSVSLHSCRNIEFAWTPCRNQKQNVAGQTHFGFYSQASQVLRCLRKEM